VWFFEADGVVWLEAGAPENGWYRDVLRDPRLRLTVDGDARPYLAHPVEDPAVHASLRSRLRAKYGLRDWWVGNLVDPARSIPVRLEARAETP